MADDLPGKLILDERNAIRDKYLLAYSVRFPEARTDEGTQPFIDASAIADAQVSCYSNAKTIADNASLDNKSLASLIAYADTIGLVPNHLPATPSTGFVRVSTSLAGATVIQGQQAKDVTGRLFECTQTGVYGDGGYVPMQSSGTGPLMNIDPGTVLTWVAQTPGLGPTCVVFEETNGQGFTGGAEDETADALRNRIRDFQANPPASGNVGALISFIENIPGLPIQKAFIYPDINGPGSSGIGFTVRPDSPGADRTPSVIQIGQVQAQLINAFPADDSYFMCSLVNSPQPLEFIIQWAPQAVGWADAQPWPEYVPARPVAVDGAFARTASQVTLLTLSSHANPQPGQTIAFLDIASGTFKRKQILSVTTLSSGLHWTLTFDMTNNASDPTFIPQANQYASPWSDSLSLIVTPVQQFFDLLGPGEQVASFYDAGIRQRRQPPGPSEWSSQLTSRLLTGLYSLSAINDIELAAPSLPRSTPIGSPGVFSYLFKLSDIAVHSG